MIRFISPLVSGLLILFFLSGCAEATAVLPTLASPAEPVALAPAAAVGEPDANVPPTWTPQPGTASAVEGNWDAAVPRTPTMTPSVPTSTPIPPTPTPTPPETATPLPYISEIPNLPPSGRLGPSKLGIHVIQNNSPAIMDFVRRAQPAVMKSVGDFGFLEEVKQVSPRTITIGRVAVEHQHYGGIPEIRAREMINEQLRQYQLNPYVDYWEGWNEPHPKGHEEIMWYTRFEQERVRYMAELGFRAAIGGYPAGVPEVWEFEMFLPAVETAKQHGGILTLHEGAAPDVDFLYGAPLPGYPAYPDRGALSFRYRWYYRELMEPRDLVIPLVLSEFAVDGMLGNRPGPLGLGWRDFEQYWVSHGRWGRDGTQAYINQMAWFDNGARQDGYVIGFTIFTAGGGDRWLTYEVNDILPQFADYVVSQRGR
jgi:hypothetical protein